jgi:hypothetical protein
VKRLVLILPLWLLALACSKDSAKPTPAPSSDIPDPFLAPPPSAGTSSAAAPSTATSPSPSTSESTSSPALPVPESTVKLLDPGREPRRELRYTWRPDRKEHMAIELATTISADGGGQRSVIPLAPLEIGIDVEPQSVSPAGDLRFAWHVVSAAVGALDASSPPEVAQGWSAQLVPVEHLSGTASVSSRGISRGISLDVGSAGDAGNDHEMVVQVLQMLRDAAAPLPDEPVGPGARWQKVSTLDARNGHATQNDTYTLVELQADQGSLADVLAQTASPQALPSPAGLPPSTPARMDQLLTSGNAKMRFDLTRLVAQTSLDGTTSMALSAPSSRMNMTMILGITVRGTTTP